MNAKMSVFAMCVEAIKYFYYIICMTVPLRTPKIFNQVSTIWKLEHVLPGCFNEGNVKGCWDSNFYFVLV